MRKKKRPPTKPKREYQWLGAVWIGSIVVFLTVMVVADGQSTLGGPEGTFIMIDEPPFTIWAGVGFPATVSAAMIALLIGCKFQFRDQLSAYQQELDIRDQRNHGEIKCVAQ